MLPADGDRSAALSGEFVELVAQLSSRFIDVPAADFDSEVEAALQRILWFFVLDRCALFKVDDGGMTIRVIHRAKPAHDTPLPNEFSPTGPMPWVYATVVEQGQTLAIRSIDRLPPEAAADAKSMKRGGVRSALLIPIAAGLPVEYVLALASIGPERHWTAAHTVQLRLLGELIVGAIRRKALEDGQRDALRSDQLASAILSIVHDLCQPLTAILSNANAGVRFLARGQPDLKEIGAILQDIADDDKRAGEIIASLRKLLQVQQQGGATPVVPKDPRTAASGRETQEKGA